jgi:hypothetical protein
MCFDPDTYILDGPWKNQLTYIRPVPAVFISNTRAKTRTRKNDISKYDNSYEQVYNQSYNESFEQSYKQSCNQSRNQSRNQ